VSHHWRRNLRREAPFENVVMADFSLKTSVIPGVILAGGQSTRMGIDKACAVLGGKTLLDHALIRLEPQVYEVAVNAENDVRTGLIMVPDIIPEKIGPMAGIHAAMVYGSAMGGVSHVATVSVDSPFFPEELVANLSAVIDHPLKIAIAASQGRSHPVFGLWPVSLADDLFEWIAMDGKRRVRDFLLRHDVTEVSFPLHPTRASMLDPFLNINTPDELREAERWLEAMTK
jgi:molybdenum cofactor guanylyltransferase